MTEDGRTAADEIRDLTRAMRALEDRVARLESPSVAAAPSPVTVLPPDNDDLEEFPPVPQALLRSPPFVGRLLLVLGGAYLLRALTEGEQVLPAVGAGLGYVYGLVWLVFAHRAGRLGKAYAATWHGVSAAMITLPLVWETSARFGILSFPVAAALLAAAAILALAIAWRHRLAELAGLFTVGAGAVALVTLLPNGDAVLPMNAALVAIGVVAHWVGRTRGWLAPPWCGGLAAVAGGLLLAARTLSNTGPDPAYAMALLLLLFISYVASIVVSALRGWHRLDVYDGVQTVLVLLVGFEGASRIAQQTGTGQPVLGLATLAVAVVIYLRAFTVLDRERRRCFQYLTSLALVLVLTGSAGLLEHPTIPWSLLSVATLLTGRRLGRATLGVHAVTYAVAALLASGVLAEILAAWATIGSELPHTLQSWLAIGAVAATALWPVASSRAESVVWGRAARGAALVLLLVTLGGLALRGVVALLPSTLGESGVAWQAAARTVVVAVLAVGAALIARRSGLRLLGRLVPVVLAAGAVKLAFEDLPNGRPASLAISFGAFGAALILAPRILRARPEPPADESD